MAAIYSYRIYLLWGSYRLLAYHTYKYTRVFYTSLHVCEFSLLRITHHFCFYWFYTFYYFTSILPVLRNELWIKVAT